MIEWSISAAINADCFDRIIVSTDDSEISKVAKSLGRSTIYKTTVYIRRLYAYWSGCKMPLNGLSFQICPIQMFVVYMLLHHLLLQMISIKAYQL